uniref:50S ribosomal protein L2 n=1 Tax=Elaeophora elaphi TaxID=1147741 RepID=A0A0R3RSF4_9BILA
MKGKFLEVAVGRSRTTACGRGKIIGLTSIIAKRSKGGYVEIRHSIASASTRRGHSQRRPCKRQPFACNGRFRLGSI